MMCQTSQEINEIADALAKAQSEIENVEKDGKNPHFKSRYATLSAVLDEVRPKFAKNGIAIVQMAVNGDGSNVGVITRLVHKSGQWIESGLYVAPTKFDAQGAGSVISYLRRYALMAMAGVGQDDDDAEAAIGRPDQRSAPARAREEDPFTPPAPAARRPDIAEPPEMTHQRAALIREWWKRDSYAVNPEVIDGGMGAFDWWLLRLAEAAPSFDAFIKLRDDSKPHYMRWRATVAAPVVNSLTEKMKTIGARLEMAEQQVAAE